MITVLAIDTAAPRLQLALLGPDGQTDTSIDDLAQGHAELIFDRIGRLLERNGLGHTLIERIAVTTGPGSFTGLRIGLSAARGLGLARDLPVIGVPSLLALSFSGPAATPFSVLLDARRGEAYFQPFAAPATPLAPPMVLAMQDARDRAGTAPVIESPFVDIALLARFAQTAAPEDFVPEAAYVRSADAKPQDRARIARRREEQ
ncbi:tRNA (adenosine(37)-N6)-threonylcarbamoyltransferase complex dimerization subunit type 1 TsaB [Arsenicitalea aurantiaca]|uniref:tRNA (Adenosine(37)-N6)-threonylcarbamoyltransferase complex dimerization subunit type 1 TsaB n=1 Tax=Arsenicitalea aurantiaca TaxID=1783274 RepID=A0A433X7Z9_9HYPH|nr:tRNA (adenosine(37)-N6)-threonylcarbamoyltransferase complex dimerization subunit type 1 TsaB [Arsenicitalea aurantiaca]RUT30196.1 tRNA (adenosine(37)-N6)-threonylcarbamoyltransferase complex dimerization subunit type 1 TsaB [Arsenicitalea aurantiaca]